MEGFQLGFLATFPILAASITQLILPNLISNQKIGFGLITTSFLQFLSIIGIVYTHELKEPFWHLLLFLSIYWIGGQNTTLFWLDFTSNFFKKEDYSKFFATRSTFVVIVTMIFYLLFSYLLENHISFKILFIIGAISRFISLSLNFYIVKKIKPINSENKLSNKQNHDSVRTEKKVIKRFFIWGGIFRIAVNISSPFFMTYMIKDLALPTTSYVILSSIPFLGRALYLKSWEKTSKHGRIYYGVQVAAFIIAFLPFGWTVSHAFVYLIFLQILSGIFWGGMELSQVMMIQHHSHQNSRRLLGIQQTIFTFMSTIGAMIGGGLIERNYKLDELFIISTIGRLIVAIGLIYNLRRFTPSRLNFKSGRIFLFSVLTLRPSPANSGRAIVLPGHSPE